MNPTAPQAHLRVAVISPHANAPDIRRAQPPPRTDASPVGNPPAGAVTGATADLAETTVGLVEQHSRHAVVVEAREAADVRPVLGVGGERGAKEWAGEAGVLFSRETALKESDFQI